MQSILTPDWVKDAVFYQIFPDRFAKSDSVYKAINLEAWDTPPTTFGFKGGDLIGVVNHLDYLSELGVTAIYFCPVFQSTANHRYHTHDYYNVDPILGGNAALRRLVDAAHERNIKVVLDGVFNHASRGFYYFNHLLENGPASPYTDWFNVKRFPVNAYNEKRPPNYDAWWNLHALPEFNTDTPAVREYLWSVGEYWIDFGIDGWRLDVPNEINDDEFWREFRRRVKNANPEAYIVGEIWGDASRWLSGDQFDAVMNYLFTKAAAGFFIEQPNAELVQGLGYGPIPTLNGHDMAVAIESLLLLYPQAITGVQLNLLGSHDTPRFLSIADGDISALKLATLFQMTYAGAPCVYYGDEIGLLGGKDPMCRGTFPWEETRWNKEILTHVQAAIALRHQYPALRRGTYSTLYARDGVWCYARDYEGQRLVVAFNNSRNFSPFEFPSSQGSALQSVFGEIPAERTDDGLFRVTLPPRSGAVWVVA